MDGVNGAQYGVATGETPIEVSPVAGAEDLDGLWCEGERREGAAAGGVVAQWWGVGRGGFRLRILPEERGFEGEQSWMEKKKNGEGRGRRCWFTGVDDGEDDEREVAAAGLV
ncbi:hypothetical protein HAX54_001761 [Datura stramonium]|uniref:Uncharacterized protein n=1 Tax=Datura stramonium TaxID=4076 RepID=A0ABS8T4Y2_DATST|nr:hypothetical protein [Datura stramonium]